MKEGFVPHLVEDDAVVDSSNLKDKHTKDAFDPDGGISRIHFCISRVVILLIGYIYPPIQKYWI